MGLDYMTTVFNLGMMNMDLDWKNPKDNSDFKGGICTFGNFDGVHLGHQNLISQASDLSEKLAIPCVAITFHPHPAKILRPEKAPVALSTLEQKISFLKKAGADHVLTLNTADGLLDLEAKDFFERVVAESLGAKALLEGPGFRFGKNRTGDANLLDSLCKSAGMQFFEAKPFEMDGGILSSTRIRNALNQGNLDCANRWLGRNYSITGTVVQGAQRGRSLGFPTANLEKISTAIPQFGVYAGFCQWGQSNYPAAIHIGPNPTFGEQAAKVEIHLLGFSGDLYGTPLEIHFLKKIRDIFKFDGKEALIRQLESDIEATRQIFGNFH